MAMVLLNSALYRAWIAGGPPSDNPEGWLFSAWTSFGCAVSAALIGVGLFLALRKRPLSKAAIVLLATAVLLAMAPSICEFIATDRCLDGGGKWSNAELRCVHE
jgi:hypothetical protein